MNEWMDRHSELCVAQVLSSETAALLCVLWLDAEALTGVDCVMRIHG